MPRTFEDSIIYTNLEILEAVGDSEKGLIKKIKEKISSSKSFDELHKALFELLNKKGMSSQKAEFVLDLIFSIDPADLTIPVYIEEGLEWLQNLLRRED